MGAPALWQSTDQTNAHAAAGAGTRRRVREFRIAADHFALLNTSQAVVHTTLGPPPVTCQVKASDSRANTPNGSGPERQPRGALLGNRRAERRAVFVIFAAAVVDLDCRGWHPIA